MLKLAKLAKERKDQREREEIPGHLATALEDFRRSEPIRIKNEKIGNKWSSMHIDLLELIVGTGFLSKSDSASFRSSCRSLWQTYLDSPTDGPLYLRKGVTWEMHKADKQLRYVRIQREMLERLSLRYSFWDGKLRLYGKKGRIFEYANGYWHEQTPKGLVTYAYDGYAYAEALRKNEIDVDATYFAKPVVTDTVDADLAEAIRLSLQVQSLQVSNHGVSQDRKDN